MADFLTEYKISTATEEEKDTIVELDFLRQHYNEVKSHLLKHKLYSEKLILFELDWFYYNLGLSPYYFKRFPPEQAYRHIEAYIAAKQVAFANGMVEDIRIDGVETAQGTIFICPNDAASIQRVEEAIEDFSSKVVRFRFIHSVFLISRYVLSSLLPTAVGER
jgi:hypothetical protein